MANSTGTASDSLQLIDVLFTAVMTIGLTPEVLSAPHINGMLSEHWVMSALAGNWTVPSSGELTSALAFTIGVVTLLLSWFGIHASLRAKPITYDSVWGMLRFILDIALIFLYGLVLIFFRQPQAVLLLLALIYTLFVVWDLLKTMEYRAEFWSWSRIRTLAGSSGHSSAQANGTRRLRATLDSGRRWLGATMRHFKRQLVSVWFALCFVLLWKYSSGLTSTALLFVALAITVLYRVAKYFPVRGAATTIIIGVAAYSWEQIMGVA